MMDLDNKRRTIRAIKMIMTECDIDIENVLIEFHFLIYVFILTKGTNTVTYLSREIL